MARRYPNRPRHRPGRRPVYHPPGGQARSAPRGFTSPGYRQFYAWLMPGLAGNEKRQFFNEVSGSVVLAAGLCGAGLGFACLGWVGGALGLGAGIAAGGSFVEAGRYYRR